MNPWRVGYRMTKPRYWSYLILPMKIWRNWKIDQYFSKGQLKSVVQLTKFENLQQTSFLASVWVYCAKVVKGDATTYIQLLYPDKQQIWLFSKSCKISKTLPLTQKISDICTSRWCHCRYSHVIFLRRKPVLLQKCWGPFVTDKEHWHKNFSLKFLILYGSTTKQLTSSTEKGYNSNLQYFSQDNFGSWNFWKQDQFSVKFCLENRGNN